MYCIVNSIDPLDLKDDDNDSDCSDSWELLDYEKEIDENNKTSEQTEKKNINDNSKDIEAAGSSKQQAKSKSRGQKQKVSFEIPDLVKEEKTIELTTPKEDVSKETCSKAGRKKKQNAANKSIAELTSQTTKSISQKVGTSSKQEQQEKNIDVEIIVKSVEPTKEAQAQPYARAPILNYAAALTSKLDNSHTSSKKLISEASPEAVTNCTTDSVAVSQSRGVVKRNRPVSSSSWSSCDDEIIKEINLIWEENDVNKGIDVCLEMPNINNNNDGDSMVSSGFSECDYGFGFNDYAMKPKKARAKRRRNSSSTSNSLLNSMARRESERVVTDISSKKNDRISVEVKDSKSKVPVVNKQSTSSRQIKPKKKKLVLSSPTVTQSDFLKRTSENVVPQSLKKSSLSNYQTAPTDMMDKTVEIAKKNNERQLMPPPSSSAAASIASGNDSSDIPDMDESWYLTPPPCFTGAAANKLCIIPKPKAKEAARENLLIEHPSIYIASTSKQVTLPSEKSTKELLIKQKAIVLKKVSSKQSSVSTSSSSRANERKSGPKMSTNEVTKDNKNNKCWENKFVVANWADDDDQADVNDDFDNLFPVMERKQSTTSKVKKSDGKDKSKRKSQQGKGKKINDSQPALAANLSSTDDYESDFSIPSPSSLEEVIVDDYLVNPSKESEDVVGAIGQGENPEQTKRRRRNKSSSSDVKVPLKVDPIEPERQPGWQLKKKRSKRRPLVSPTVSAGLSSVSKQPVSSRQPPTPAFSPYGELAYVGSAECSARSTPTLINRIGSSIVANLSNLTSGFACSTGMNLQTRAPMNEVTEKMNRFGSIRKSESVSHNLKTRKQMSRSFLNRQNGCLKISNSTRQPDRRTKMCTTPNGVSVNRKVQTNFH